MPSVRKKLNTINALVIAFDNHPDEELREAVRQQVNEFVSWGMLQKQLQDKRASEKELTK